VVASGVCAVTGVVAIASAIAASQFVRCMDAPNVTSESVGARASRVAGVANSTTPLDPRAPFPTKCIADGEVRGLG